MQNATMLATGYIYIRNLQEGKNLINLGLISVAQKLYIRYKELKVDMQT